MKRIMLVFLVFFLVACKSKKPWTKDALVNDCLREFNKKNEEQPRFTGMQIPYLCDCMAEKLVVKYKSDAESSKDKEGAIKITTDCVTDVMSK